MVYPFSQTVAVKSSTQNCGVASVPLHPHGGPWLEPSYGSCWGALHASHDRSSFLSESRQHPPLGQSVPPPRLLEGWEAGLPRSPPGSVLNSPTCLSLFNFPAPFSLPSCLTKLIRHFTGGLLMHRSPCRTPIHASVVGGRAESPAPLGCLHLQKRAPVGLLLPDPHVL